MWCLCSSADKHLRRWAGTCTAIFGSLQPQIRSELGTSCATFQSKLTRPFALQFPAPILGHPMILHSLVCIRAKAHMYAESTWSGKAPQMSTMLCTIAGYCKHWQAGGHQHPAWRCLVAAAYCHPKRGEKASTCTVW